MKGSSWRRPLARRRARSRADQLLGSSRSCFSSTVSALGEEAAPEVADHQRSLPQSGAGNPLASQGLIEAREIRQALPRQATSPDWRLHLVADRTHGAEDAALW